MSDDPNERIALALETIVDLLRSGVSGEARPLLRRPRKRRPPTLSTSARAERARIQSDDLAALRARKAS